MFFVRWLGKLLAIRYYLSKVLKEVREEVKIIFVVNRKNRKGKVMR